MARPDPHGWIKNGCRTTWNVAPDVGAQVKIAAMTIKMWAFTRHERSGSGRSVVALIAKGLCFDLLAASFIPYQAVAADGTTQLSNLSCPLSAHQGAVTPSTIEGEPAMVVYCPKRANFEREYASHEVRHVADWVVDSENNLRMPFVIVDKTNAKVFVFDADGRLRGATAALLGAARGDDTVPGIGDRKLSSIRPEERTTPAGRFVAALDHNIHGEEILWVDYNAGISMHRVITTNPMEHRLLRLATPTPLDNRISYGCINVPAKFYDKVVHPAFTGTNGIVYILPETRLTCEVFNLYDVEELAQLPIASQLLPVQPASTVCVNKIR
ncbi:hypothetical protein CCP3SC15_1370002 [Gammaproteobacteria bacterium]